jgi:hypothetical protein
VEDGGQLERPLLRSLPHHDQRHDLVLDVTKSRSDPKYLKLQVHELFHLHTYLFEVKRCSSHPRDVPILGHCMYICSEVMLQVHPLSCNLTFM